jgi:hypothetical protein
MLAVGQSSTGGKMVKQVSPHVDENAVRITFVAPSACSFLIDYEPATCICGFGTDPGIMHWEREHTNPVRLRAKRQMRIDLLVSVRPRVNAMEYSNSSDRR